MLTYNIEVIAKSQEDFLDLRQILEWQKLAYNEASKIQFEKFKNEKPNSIVFLHAEFYKKFRHQYPQIPAQIVIKAENDVLSAYRSVKSNKHKIYEPIIKKKLSTRLDARLFKKVNIETIRITTANKRKTFQLKLYPKVRSLLEKYEYGDPLLFERNGRLFLSLTFNTKIKPIPSKLALGIDLGVRINAACSDGKLFRDKNFNARKRQIRYLKHSLKKHNTKSSRRKLRKLGHKERNMTRNFNHHLANSILNTSADTIVLENLNNLTFKKRGKRGTKQACFGEIQDILTYKANNQGKKVLFVSPCFTSQTDPITGHKTGERKGRRFYANNGLIYDADIAASWNIAKRSKLPYLQGNLLMGQAKVTSPIVCKSRSSNKDQVLQAPEFIPG